MNEYTQLIAREEAVLSKFEGEAKPENEFERIKIVDGVIVEHWRIENGVQVEDLLDKGVN